MDKPRLEQRQQWLQSLLLAPGPLPQRLAAQAAAWGFDEYSVVAAGGPATVRRRLGIYAAGYRQRLLDCLAADFPALRQLLGEGLFAHFGELYLGEHPSQSFTLFDLGEGFAEFLARTRPKNAAPYFRLPESIARIERARHEVLRAPGLEEAVAEEWTPERLLFEGRRLSLAPCCRLLELSFDLKEFYLALLRKEDAILPAEKPSWLALGRARYRLTIEALTEAEHCFLAACTAPRHFYELLAQSGIAAADALLLMERFRRAEFIDVR